MSVTLTVYENNQTDSPREVTAQEVVREAKKHTEDETLRLMPAQSINIAAARFGSFDPQSEEYRQFEEEAVQILRDTLFDD